VQFNDQTWRVFFVADPISPATILMSEMPTSWIAPDCGTGPACPPPVPAAAKVCVIGRTQVPDLRAEPKAFIERNLALSPFAGAVILMDMPEIAPL